MILFFLLIVSWGLHAHRRQKILPEELVSGEGLSVATSLGIGDILRGSDCENWTGLLNLEYFPVLVIFSFPLSFPVVISNKIFQICIYLW